MFKDLSSLVIDQGTLLDRVDYNVEQMSTEVKGAVQELQQATRCVCGWSPSRAAPRRDVLRVEGLHDAQVPATLWQVPADLPPRPRHPRLHHLPHLPPASIALVLVGDSTTRDDDGNRRWSSLDGRDCAGDQRRVERERWATSASQAGGRSGRRGGSEYATRRRPVRCALDAAEAEGSALGAGVGFPPGVGARGIDLPPVERKCASRPHLVPSLVLLVPFCFPTVHTHARSCYARTTATMVSAPPPHTTSNGNGHAADQVSLVDVAVIGAGPAGCMASPLDYIRAAGERRELTLAPTRGSQQAADVLARFSARGLTVRVFDKRSAKLDNGADSFRSHPETSSLIPVLSASDHPLFVRSSTSPAQDKLMDSTRARSRFLRVSGSSRASRRRDRGW